MFEIPKHTDEEWEIFKKVERIVTLMGVESWADAKGIDLTQKQADKLATRLLLREDDGLKEFLDYEYEYYFKRD